MFPLVVNVTAQILQLNGLSPLWTSICLSRLELELSTFEQILQVKPLSLMSSSLLCERMWRVNSCWEVRVMSHIGQKYLVSCDGELQLLALSLSVAVLLMSIGSTSDSVVRLWAVSTELLSSMLSSVSVRLCSSLVLFRQSSMSVAGNKHYISFMKIIYEHKY